MNRDCLFANDVNKKCKETGYFSIINNGECSIDDLLHKVSVHLELEG